MPKAFLQTRSSGVYARYLVPGVLQPHWGAQYIVRALRQRGDAARLAAAQLGYALGRAFAMAKDQPVDTKKLIKSVLDAHEAGSLRHYTVAHTPGGGMSISADGAEDHARAMEALAAMQRLAPSAPTVLVSPALLAPAKPMLLLSAAVDLFLKQFAQKQRAASNVLDTGHTLKLLLGLVDDKPLSEVDAQDMDLFLDAIAHLPPNATKRWPQLTVVEVLARAKAEGFAGLSHRTQEKHLDRLRVFFGWAFERGDIARNPAKSLHVMTRAQEDASTREAFTPAELARIFDPSTRAAECDQPHRWWGPLIALFTGARVTEIAQLWIDDLEQIDGNWGFHFAPRTERGQRIKNAVSRRFVPVHPALLEAGLLAYRDEVVAAFGTSRLLPGLSNTNPGDTLGDWFNRTYRKVVKVEGVFHGFRHTFASRAERCGLSDARLGRLTGHSAGGSVLRKHYIDPPSLAERASDMAKVRFEGLPALTPYRLGQFTAYFAATQRRMKIAAAKETRRQRALKPE
jgi:integrase